MQQYVVAAGYAGVCWRMLIDDSIDVWQLRTLAVCSSLWTLRPFGSCGSDRLAAANASCMQQLVDAATVWQLRQRPFGSCERYL
jgi:hypothetical protein